MSKFKQRSGPLISRIGAWAQLDENGQDIPSSLGSASYTVPTSLERIEYSTSRKPRKKARRPTNWCFHTKTSVDFYVISLSDFPSTEDRCKRHRIINGEFFSGQHAMETATSMTQWTGEPARVTYRDAESSALGAKADVFETLAEIKQLKGLAKPFTSLPKSGKQASDKYLAYQFGLKPLFQVAEDLGKALGDMEQSMKRLRKGFTTTCTKKSTVSVDNKYTIGGYRSSWEIHVKGSLESKKTVLYKVAPVNLPSIPSFNLLASKLGANVTIRRLWNIVPLSFVLDWFLNISKFLDNFDYDTVEIDISPYEGWAIIKGDLKITVSCVDDTYTCDGSLVGRTGMVGTLKVFQRIPASFDLDLTPIQLGEGIDPGKAASLTALGRQRLKSTKPTRL